jgi:hypothetical protein
MSQDQKQNAQALPQKDKPATDIYHVVGPGSITRGKSQIKANEIVELTAAEAAALGGLVAKGEAPKPPPDPQKRAAGRYRFIGKGTCWYNGVERSAGFVMDLTEKDARALGDQIEPA